MPKLSELFWNCHCGVKYETVGDDVNYAFVPSGDCLYIYFQGSSSVSDWIANFLFKKRPYKDMDVAFRVHRGFLRCWKQVEDLVIDKILEKDGSGEYVWKKIVVVGYSHGGALAGFCHECCWYYRPDLREDGLTGYGFESPRFFGSLWVRKSLRERWSTFYVYRNCLDIVTHCPPFFFGYCHVGTLIKIGKKSSGLIKDHYPENVKAALEEYEKGE